MIPQDLKTLSALMEKMQELEFVISSFYAECSVRWPQDGDFWTAISKEEVEHAENIAKMRELVIARPERFEVGRLLNVQALETVIKGIQGKISQVREGTLSRPQALFFSRDFENSLFEKKYAEVLKTSDLEYQGLVHKIIDETGSHQARLAQKIAEVPQ